MRVAALVVDERAPSSERVVHGAVDARLHADDLHGRQRAQQARHEPAATDGDDAAATAAACCSAISRPSHSPLPAMTSSSS